MAHRKPLQWLTIALAAGLLLAGCSPVAPNLVLPKATAENVQNLAITPSANAELTVEELAQILHIYRWKLHIQVPAGQWVHYQLELHQPGQTPQRVASFAVESPNPVDDTLLVALYPIDGTLLQATQIEYFISAGGGSTSAVIENPATAYTQVGPISPPRQLETSGEGQSFVLMEFGHTGQPLPSPENTRLVLSVQPDMARP